MSNAIVWTIALTGAYLIGAVPFGLVLGRLKGIDIRAHGSGNIGATNVRRVLGPALGNLCFVLDLLKGALPTVFFALANGVYDAVHLSPPVAWGWAGVGVATVLGHVFPIYLGFKGGKGVATAFGAMLALWPFTTLAALGALGVWIGSLRIWRMVSVASCLAAVSLPSFVVLRWLIAQDPPGVIAPFLSLTTALAALVLVKHRGNFARIRAGTEPKIGARP